MPATYVNSKLPRGRAPVQAGSFFGHYEPQEQMSDESMLAMMQTFTQAHNQEIAE